MEEKRARDMESETFDEAKFLTPMHDMVLVRFVPDEANGVIIRPDTAADSARFKCLVLAVGPGRQLKDGSMSIPDPAMIGKHVIVTRQGTWAEIRMLDHRAPKLFLAEYGMILSLDERREAKAAAMDAKALVMQ